MVLLPDSLDLAQMQPKTTFPYASDPGDEGWKGGLIHTKVMGIINATPDSFFSESRVARRRSRTESCRYGKRRRKDAGYWRHVFTAGADIIDPEREATRVIPIVQAVAQAFPHIPVSIDTIHADVAEAAVEAGASIINDISAATWGQAHDRCCCTDGGSGHPHAHAGYACPDAKRSSL